MKVVRRGTNCLERSASINATKYIARHTIHLSPLAEKDGELYYVGRDFPVERDIGIERNIHVDDEPQMHHSNNECTGR